VNPRGWGRSSNALKHHRLALSNNEAMVASAKRPPETCGRLKEVGSRQRHGIQRTTQRKRAAPSLGTLVVVAQAHAFLVAERLIADKPVGGKTTFAERRAPSAERLPFPTITSPGAVLRALRHVEWSKRLLSLEFQAPVQATKYRQLAQFGFGTDTESFVAAGKSLMAVEASVRTLWVRRKPCVHGRSGSWAD
jgi:hypothetical protein